MSKKVKTKNNTQKQKKKKKKNYFSSFGTPYPSLPNSLPPLPVLGIQWGSSQPKQKATRWSFQKTTGSLAFQGLQSGTRSTQNHQKPGFWYLKTRFFGGENHCFSWFWVPQVNPEKKGRKPSTSSATYCEREKQNTRQESKKRPKKGRKHRKKTRPSWVEPWFYGVFCSSSFLFLKEKVPRTFFAYGKDPICCVVTS